MEKKKAIAQKRQDRARAKKLAHISEYIVTAKKVRAYIVRDKQWLARIAPVVIEAEKDEVYGPIILRALSPLLESIRHNLQAHEKLLKTFEG